MRRAPPFAALVLAGSAAAAGQAERATFAVGVEAVYVDVFVSDRDGPLGGLRAEDFEVRDEGRRRPFELVAAETLPLRVLLVLDTSASVTGTKLEQLRTAATALVLRLGAADQAGLLTFSEEVRLLARPTPERAPLLESVQRIESGGATAVYDALYAATLVGSRGNRAVVVLFTDGEDNMSWLDAARVRQALLQSDVLLQVVGVVPSQPESYETELATIAAPREPTQIRALRELAELTGGRFWKVPAPDQLEGAFLAILGTAQHRYVLRFEPAPGSRPGLRRLQVKLRNRRGRVQARQAYFLAPRSR